MGVGLLVGLGLLGWVTLRAPEKPTSAGDCAWVLAPGPKKDCMAEVAIAMFRTDPKGAQAFVEAQIPETLQRDFIYDQVTWTVDGSSMRWCDLIKDSFYRDHCKVRVGRPHLNGPPAGGRPGAPGSGSPPPGAPQAPSEPQTGAAEVPPGSGGAAVAP